jgi:Fe-S-cluster-containing dehydrogenase component
MPVSRRSLLKGAVAAGAATALPRAARAREKVRPLPDAVGMLYDSTRCAGCGGCVAACKESNRTPIDRNAVHERDAHGIPAFIKRQCMHCVDPSCVSACMLGALHKEGEGKRDLGGERPGTGIVLYDAGLCLGCRYCQIACPFEVPRFEWAEAFPRILKCELCRHRADPAKGELYAVANPACCQVCPAEAVVYGRRADLLAEARRRIAAEPDRYNPKIYGEVDGGGTQVLYLAGAGVSFAELGFPELTDRSPAQFSETISHAPYLHGVAPVAFYAAAAFVVRRNRRRQEEEEGEGK